MYTAGDSLSRQISSHSANSSLAPVVGWLVGAVEGSDIHLASCIGVSPNDQSADAQAVQDLGEVQDLLPAGLAVVGILIRDEAFVKSTVYKLLHRALAGQEQAGSTVVIAEAGDSAVLHEADQYGDLRPVEVKPTGPSTPAGRALLLRLSLSLAVEVYQRQDVPLDQALSHAFATVINELCSESALFLAALPEQGQVLLNGSQQYCRDLQACGGGTPVPLSCHMRRQPHVAATSQCIAPWLQYQPVKGGPVQRQVAPLELDVLAYAPAGMQLGTCVTNVIQPGIRRQLAAMHAAMRSLRTVTPHCAYLFSPASLDHHISVVFPCAKADAEARQDSDEAKQRRLRLHARLDLPLDRPALRIANAEWPDASDSSPASSSGRLRDVHIGIADSGIPGGSVHTIWGSYDYHHYMQDKFDDSGWGCAYRSLQTLWSWLRVQHYTSAPVPTHRQIQQTLVDIGDKPRWFVGSKQWLGAIELGYVLDTCLGVTCKVLTVASGADIESKARELAQHFDEQGTPVMIGGGVLAYTLLGVHFDAATGECAFLILDPHYTGQDALPRIHSGQWVAWKRLGGTAAAGGQLFRSDAYYNLLCPQRPQLV